MLININLFISHNSENKSENLCGISETGLFVKDQQIKNVPGSVLKSGRGVIKSGYSASADWYFDSGRKVRGPIPLPESL